MRYEAIQAILPSLEKATLKREELLSEASSIEKAKSAPGVRLQIILTKLRVNQSCENSARRAMVASGVELASELFAISYQVAVNRPAYDHPGFDEMAQMLTLEAKCDLGYAMQLARSISSPVLQAYSIATVSKF